jgi:ribonuclease BN (tRNA processing enzyme)
MNNSGKHRQKVLAAEEKFFPKIESLRSRFHLWGTRGSIPVSGQRYLHHGGNTSCISFEAGREIIIFDAGTGIRELGAVLAKQKPRKLNIFIGHTHWDHIQGFPFFAPAYIPGFELMIYGASGFGKELKSIIKGQLDKDYFPVQMEDMRASIEFRHLSESPLEIGDFKIYWTLTHHPGATLGFKIEIENQKIAYISDNEFLKGYLGHPGKITARSEILVPYQKLVDFLSDADMLIGEAQYNNEEYQYKIGWGHSSLSNACVLVKLAGIRKWIVVHHDPAHDDDLLQDKMNLHRQILKELGHPVELYDGFDGRIQYL